MLLDEQKRQLTLALQPVDPVEQGVDYNRGQAFERLVHQQPCRIAYQGTPIATGIGGCPGLLPFPAARLEMTSSSRVEIRISAISTCSPPIGDQPALNVVLSARTPVRVLSPDEIQRMLAEHRLYLETEYHQGHRANFSSADLAGRDFSGLNLRGIKIDRALLSGADFTGAHFQGANLTGVISERAYFDRADLSRARLSGANLVSSSLEDACLAKAEMEFALMVNVVGVRSQTGELSSVYLIDRDIARVSRKHD